MLTACGGGSSNSTGSANLSASNIRAIPLPLTANQPIVVSRGSLDTADYGTGEREQVTLLEPYVGTSTRGLIVAIHGGGWSSGHREDTHALLDQSRQQGWAVLSVGYPLSSTIVVDNTNRAVNPWPAARNAVSRALQALEQGQCSQCSNISVWQRAKQYSQHGIMVMGVSAGGALALDSTHYYLNTVKSTRIMCIHSVVGVVDLRPINVYLAPVIQDMGLRYANYDSSISSLSAVSPAAQLGAQLWTHAATVKTLVSLANNDAIVPYSTYGDFLTKLTDFKIPHEIQNITGAVPGEGHSISWDQYQEMINWGRDACFNNWAPQQLSTRPVSAS